MPHSALPPWRLVIPVKGGAGAKSRLQPPRGVSRATLAEAMARDSTAAAAQRMPLGQVFVVAGDDRVARWAAELGAIVVVDPGEGLNAAVAAGVSAAAHQALAGASAPDVANYRPGLWGTGRTAPGAKGRTPAGENVPVAVLLGDVPALRPGDLVAGLAAAAAYDLALVPDADGTGTVLLTALDAGALHPRFGAGSARRHEDAGHRRLDLALPRLRTDVDDAASLVRAAALGLGPRTAALLAGARHPAGYIGRMQASVHSFDEATGAGTALLDDGRQVRFAGAVFQASALRKVRSGQRVSLELDDDGRTVRRLWIVGVGGDQPIR